MNNKNPFANLAEKLRMFHIRPTRTKLLLFAATLIAIGFALGGLEGGSDDEEISVASKVINLSLPEQMAITAPSAINEQLGEQAVIAPEVSQWETVTVRSGQSLDAIFRKQGFSIKTLFEIMALSDETKQLKKIRPGDLFEFQRHDDRSLKRMRYAVDEAHYLIIDHDGQQATAFMQALEIITRV
jgi:hypothetical protein